MQLQIQKASDKINNLIYSWLLIVKMVYIRIIGNACPIRWYLAYMLMLFVQFLAIVLLCYMKVSHILAHFSFNNFLALFHDLLITNDLWDFFHEKDPDLVVEAMSSSTQTGSAKPTSSSASSSAANGEARVRNSGKKPLLLKLRLWKETKLVINNIKIG